MRYSELLNGYWEEGYHYYLEFADGKLTIRDYRRAVVLETGISYDADKVESGEPTLIVLEDNVLSKTYTGEMMSEVKELIYDKGELKLLYNYTIMGETLYSLKKVDHNPFSHILIHDEKLDELRGTWVQWSRFGEGSGTLRPERTLELSGNKLSICGYDLGEVHCVSYTSAPDKLMLVPANLVDTDFNGYTSINVKEDMLTTYQTVTDMTIPMSVFARRDMLDKIEVPAEAKIQPQSSMTVSSPMMSDSPNKPGNSFMNMGTGMGMDMSSFMSAMAAMPMNQNSNSTPGEIEGKCSCGTEYRIGQRFCAGCGSPIKRD